MTQLRRARPHFLLSGTPSARVQAVLRFSRRSALSFYPENH